MSIVALFLLAGVISLINTWLVWTDARRNAGGDSQGKKPVVELLLLISIGLTFWGCLKLEPVTEQGIRFSLAGAVGIATLLVQGMYLIGLWRHGIRGLGLFLLPFTAIPLLLTPLVPHAPTEQWIHASSILESGHLMISLLSYAILTLAAIHALMHLMLDRALKRKQLGPLIQAMPSLFEIESHLFAQVWWATAMLAIGILSGLTWQWVEFHNFALFTHKVLLALFSFAVLVILLAKRKKAGWHGRRASLTVLAAYALLMLAYFGARLMSSWLA